MKVDLDYLKQLLEAFEASEKPYVSLDDIFEKTSLRFDDALIFHLQILNDKSLICQQDGTPGFGVFYTMCGGATYAGVPLRLTAEGHEFLDALKNKEVWKTLKENFKEDSIGTLKEVSKSLLMGFIKKKAHDVIGVDI